MPPFRAIFKRFGSLPKSIFTSSSTIVERSFTAPQQCFIKINALPSGARISILSHYLKNHRVDEARALFDGIPFPDVYLSSKMVSCYVDNSRLNEALELFDELPVKDTVLWNLMIKGCVNCGNLEMGLKLFDEMPDRNVVSWTTMMNAFLKARKIQEAQVLFREMPVRDIAAWNAMINGCFVNGRVDEARRLFEVMPERNVISWTTMISGLDQNGKSDEALLIFDKMVKFGVKPTSTTSASAITACVNVGNLSLGGQIHGHVVKLGYVLDTYVIASLVTFYANCRLMEDSLRAFSEKFHPNVVVWTSVLTGYGTNGKHEDALRVFADMIRLGVVPNQSSFTSALNSVCEMEDVDKGREIHSAAIKLGLETDQFVGNSLVVLYTKCGDISDGVIAFQEIATKNIVSWNAIIVGCAQNGCGEWALAFFAQMAKTGIHPDEITFTGLLNSCSQSGMLQKGRHLFKFLCHDAAVQVKNEHYACMVDILCRSGKLEEAEDLVTEMPMEANLSICLALLSGCRIESNLEVAERVAKRIFAIDPQCSAAYVLLSNIYASAGKWPDAARVRKEMERNGSVKQPGSSWIT